MEEVKKEEGKKFLNILVEKNKEGKYHCEVDGTAYPNHDDIELLGMIEIAFNTLKGIKKVCLDEVLAED